MALLPLEDGDVFAERYRIVRCIASGGMGAVYEAVHTVTERRCALKVMLAHTVERERLRERFMQESKLAAQIGSEFIVDVLDAGVDEKSKSPFLVMELLEGEDLGERLLNTGRFSAADTVRFLWDAARALDRTHQASIVHRDLKASNLFLTRREDGSPIVKVLDFGVAKVMPNEASNNEGHTQTVGTPIYMAPEQFRAEGRVSPATDIYALGMLAYTMLVGAHYWKDEHDRCANPFAFASIAVHGPQEPPSARAARRGVTLPSAFDDWFANATARKPGERFPSATEAVRELGEALNVDAELPPPTLTGNIDPVSPLSVSRPRASALPETVESASAHLSGVARGLTASTTGSRSFPNLPPPPRSATPVSSADLGPERTEVSLSVTSGGLSPLEEDTPPRRRSRPAIAVVVLAATVAAVFGIQGALRSDPPPQTVSSAETAAPPKPPALEPSALEPSALEPSALKPSPPASAATAKPEPAEEESLSIDDLPAAPPPDEPHVAKARPHRPPQRAAAKPAKVEPEPPPQKTEPEKEPEPAATTAKKPTSATVTNREQLYGRD